jgi:hypothetical protein
MIAMIAAGLSSTLSSAGGAAFGGLAWLRRKKIFKKAVKLKPRRPRPSRFGRLRRPKFRRFRRPRFRRPKPKPKVKRLTYAQQVAKAYGRKPKTFKRRSSPVRRIRRGRRFRRRRCFSPETEVQLKNGTTRQMKNLELGDVLINGSIVEATMKIKNQSDPYYKIGDIHVTGSHYVKDGNVYKQVRNFSKAELTDKVDSVVCCLVTNNHKIPVGDFMFWDWEDNLVPNHIQQPSKVTTLRNCTTNTSVVGDK